MRLYPRYANIPKVWNKDNLQRKLLESLLKSEDPFRNLIKGNESDFLEEGSIFLTFAGESLTVGQCLKPWALDATMTLESALPIFNAVWSNLLSLCYQQCQSCNLFSLLVIIFMDVFFFY